MINDTNVLNQWNIISEIWKSSERQEWFHKFILEPFFVKYLSEEICDKSKIFDYGCGSGELLQVIQNIGFNAEGFEPGNNLFHKAVQKKIKVFNELTEDHLDSYDLIILNLVLSAVENPLNVLQTAKSLLHKNGNIIITIPHPCFSLLSKYHKTTKREWITKQYNEEDILKYFSNPIQKIYWDSLDNYFTYNFYRTLEWYSETFKKINLKTKNIFEPRPISSPESMRDLFDIYSCFPSFIIFVLHE